MRSGRVSLGFPHLTTVLSCLHQRSGMLRKYGILTVKPNSHERKCWGCISLGKCLRGRFLKWIHTFLFFVLSFQTFTPHPGMPVSRVAARYGPGPLCQACDAPGAGALTLSSPWSHCQAPSKPLSWQLVGTGPVRSRRQGQAGPGAQGRGWTPPWVKFIPHYTQSRGWFRGEQTCERQQNMNGYWK